MARPHATAENMREAVLALRQKHPGRGPRKLKVLWSEAARRFQRRVRSGIYCGGRAGASPPPTVRDGGGSDPLAHAVAANDLWSITCKGWFHTRDGQR